MKNLFLFRQLRVRSPDLKNAEHFCTCSHSEIVFLYDNNTIYKLTIENGGTEKVFDMHTYYSADVPKVVHMSFNAITEFICLAFENGDVLTISMGLYDLECVGSVENGLKAVQWSPDQEVIVMVTGQDTVIVMTGTFDPIVETYLHQSGFGEKQFITAGWGKKETQFHGSEGKAAARAVPTSVEGVSVFDDGKPQISWRGDGSLFAISTVTPETNIRQIRIFSRDGALQYTSESVVGLEGIIDWRLSGNLIAASQRLPNKHVIAFFEKNGLRHGEFSLPFGQSDCRIKQLSWNTESTILAVWGEHTNGDMFLQLWTTGNYHWYLKQNIHFPSQNELLAMEWDMTHGNRLHVVCRGLSYLCYDWEWTTCNSEADGAFVAVIDGAKLLLTSFRRGIVPPPMCSETAQLPAAVNSVLFAPPDGLCAVLCNGTVVFFKQSQTHKQSMVYTIEHKLATELHHWLWIQPGCMLCCYTQGVTSCLVNVSVDVTQQTLTVGKEVPVDGLVVSMVTGDSDTALIQLQGGALLSYRPHEDKVVCLEESIPESCEVLKVCQVDGISVKLALNKFNNLYVDGVQVANNVTSLAVHSQFALLTTLKHELLCTQLSRKGLQSLREGKFGPGRRIERGARLVACVPGYTRVVLQMPRGNLECIQPRPLTLHVAGVHLDNSRYRSAFELLRRNRINLNLLCDHRPDVFLRDVDHVIDEVRDPSWLSLFLSELQDDNVVHTMYKQYYSHLEKLPAALSNKVEVVCDTVREAVQRRENADQYLLPVLTSYVQKKTDKDLADALRKVKAVREAERSTGPVRVSADEALKYLLCLVDVNHLYDVALGLYDFDLVMLVAAKSNKDPKEYLPFLNKLRRLETNYCRYTIDKHLNKYRSALTHLALCPEDDRFQECVGLVKSHKLFSQALGLFPRQSPRYLEIVSIYGDYLMDNRQYHEAGTMYTRAGQHQEALSAYLQDCNWRETLLSAKQLQYKENRLQELCRDLVTRLKSRRQYREAAEVLREHMGELEESIAVTLQGKLWAEAVWWCSHHNRVDMIDTHVRPALKEHLCNVHSQLEATRDQFKCYRDRLSVVRETKLKQRHEVKDADMAEDCDLYSDTSSTMASRTSGRSSRSSKNRRKQERKMLSLKEGSPFEEYALIRELHQLFTNAYTSTDEVHGLCRMLLKFEEDSDAADLQALLCSLLHTVESAKKEIWSPEAMQPSQTVYGPDATVNSITERLQTTVQPDAGLALLEPHLRFPPATKSTDSWKISVLSDMSPPV